VFKKQLLFEANYAKKYICAQEEDFMSCETLTFRRIAERKHGQLALQIRRQFLAIIISSLSNYE